MPNDEHEAVEAPVLMVDHYLGRGGDVLGTACMSPGETAVHALVERGFAAWEADGVRFARWTEAGLSLRDGWYRQKHGRMAEALRSRQG